MSDDAYFDDFSDFDLETLKQLDAIEAAAIAPKVPHGTKPDTPPIAQKPSEQRVAPEVIELSDSEDYGSFSIDAAQLRKIDELCSRHAQGQSVQAIAGPSRASFVQRSSSKATVQTTLFGEKLQPVPGNKKSFQRTNSKVHQREEKRVKQWDHTAFAKTGRKSSKTSRKRNPQTEPDDDEVHEEEDVEFEQFPNPVIEYVPILNSLLWAEFD